MIIVILFLVAIYATCDTNRYTGLNYSLSNISMRLAAASLNTIGIPTVLNIPEKGTWDLPYLPWIRITAVIAGIIALTALRSFTSTIAICVITIPIHIIAHSTSLATMAVMHEATGILLSDNVKSGIYYGLFLILLILFAFFLRIGWRRFVGVFTGIPFSSKQKIALPDHAPDQF